MAVLIGLAADKRGTSDPTVSKALFLHIPATHPNSFPEFELSPLVQVGALRQTRQLHTCGVYPHTCDLIDELFWDLGYRVWVENLGG